MADTPEQVQAELERAEARIVTLSGKLEVARAAAARDELARGELLDAADAVVRACETEQRDPDGVAAQRLFALRMAVERGRRAQAGSAAPAAPGAPGGT